VKPIRVTAELAEPIVYYGDGLHLDGPLSWGAYMELPAEERDAMPPLSHADDAIDLELPLARVVVEDGLLGWVWAASAVHADWLGETVVEVRKRPPEGEFITRTSAKSFHRSLGHTKAWDLRYPAALARRLVWYAVGDAEAVFDLLALHVPNVGKKARQGNGRVMRWAVEPWPHDWSVERDGELTRRMPHAFRPDAVPSRGALRTPYHHRSRQAPCVEPDFAALRP
jgi:hypothetical protein